MMSQVHVPTKYYAQVIEHHRSHLIFEYLRDNIEWIDGVKSYKGFTRKAKPISLGENDIVDAIIADVIQLIGMKQISLYGIYLNYYRDGEDYTPNHSHIGMKQIVISFGATRKLTVGTKSYNMCNGDVIIFGSSLHGVPKDPDCKDARISIALFLDKLSS